MISNTLCDRSPPVEKVRLPAVARSVAADTFFGDILHSPCYSSAMLLSEKEYKALCHKLLSYTKADDAQVSIGTDDFSHLRFAANSFTTNGRREQAFASVTVWIGKKRGSATANDFEDKSLK